MASSSSEGRKDRTGRDPVADPSSSAPGLARPFPWLFVVAAWALPGLGHFLLGKKVRGVLFLALVLASLIIGVLLQGQLYRPVPGQPLATLAGFACMAMGIPYWVVGTLMDYTGDWSAAGFEYGKAFILTAGLMNILVMLDVWDIARGERD